MASALTLLAVVALGQVTPAADIEQWWPSPLVHGTQWVGTGETAKASAFRASAAFMYSVAPFRSAPATTWLTERFGVTLTGGLGVTDWLELGVVLPVLMSHTTQAAFPVAGAGLGNPWAHATVSILDETKPVTAAFSVGVGIPAGTAAALGNGNSAEVQPKVIFGRRFRRLTLGVEVGALIRGAVDFSAVTGVSSDWVGSQALLAVAVVPALAGPLRPEVAVRGFVSLTKGLPGVELQVGARYALGPVELVASVGPGLAGQPATPGFRAMAGVSLRTDAPASP